MKKYIIIIFSILLIVGISFLGYKYLYNKNGDAKITIIDEIKDYGYKLNSNETKLYTKYFKELVLVLSKKEIDETEYSNLVIKLFISDFYNLDNKITKNDIGGTEYILASAKENMILKAKNTVYKYLENNIDDNRTQKLPIVTEVIIDSTKQIKYEYGKETDYKAYEINVSWDYKEDLGYQKEATFIIVHDNKKLSIAEIK